VATAGDIGKDVLEIEKVMQDKTAEGKKELAHIAHRATLPTAISAY
jgi:hypothetical protein